MKPLLSVLVAAAVLASAVGCAKSDSPSKRRRTASRSQRARTTASTAEPSSTPAASGTNPATPPHPADAGASNAALGTSARDAMGHPAISDY